MRWIFTTRSVQHPYTYRHLCTHGAAKRHSAATSRPSFCCALYDKATKSYMFLGGRGCVRREGGKYVTKHTRPNMNRERERDREKKTLKKSCRAKRWLSRLPKNHYSYFTVTPPHIHTHKYTLFVFSTECFLFRDCRRTPTKCVCISGNIIGMFGWYGLCYMCSKHTCSLWFICHGNSLYGFVYVRAHTFSQTQKKNKINTGKTTGKVVVKPCQNRQTVTERMR